MYTIRNAPPTCTLQFHCVGCRQGRLARHLPYSLEFARVEASRRHATNNDVMQILAFLFSIVLIHTEHSSKIYLGPMVRKNETRHGTFFDRDTDWFQIWLVFWKTGREIGTCFYVEITMTSVLTQISLNIFHDVFQNNNSFLSFTV